MRRLLLLAFGLSVSVLLLSVVHQHANQSTSGAYLGIQTQSVYGAIVPHHMLAADLIDDLLILLKDQQPETIILMGPNHFERGKFPVITSLNQWETPDGILTPNKEMIDNLITSGIVYRDDEIVKQEHSIYPLTPLIKKHLPNTTIVPLVLSNYMGKDEIVALSNTLSERANDKTIIVAAVDFSHYLKLSEAEKNDEITISYITENNVDQILTLDNAYLDSPASIAVLMLVMEKQGTQPTVVNHTNSGEMLSNPNAETTSHFEVVYYK
ncbi:MAG: AmmeMemoRadiSam system protein B [Candidatus Roizmanbacteria bacterium]|nr:AmmeMemoRadiSam system protein B [Candidatus Roizmanbacteria bacterium]